MLFFFFQKEDSTTYRHSHVYLVRLKPTLSGLLVRLPLLVFLTSDRYFVLMGAERFPLGVFLAILVIFRGRKRPSGVLLLLYGDAFTWSSDILLLRRGAGMLKSESTIAYPKSSTHMDSDKDFLFFLLSPSVALVSSE